MPVSSGAGRGVGVGLVKKRLKVFLAKWINNPKVGALMNTPETQSGSSLQRVVSRRSFEDWIGGPPYERDLYRWPMDETKHAWPGQYKDIAVQLAWEAWCEAANVVFSDPAP